MLCPQDWSALFALLHRGTSLLLSTNGACKMLGKFQYAPCLEGVYRHSTNEITSWYRSVAAALSTIRDALIEALAAHRRYEHLMSRGMPHDTALRLATGTHIAGIGPRLRTHHRLRPRSTMPRTTSGMRTT